MARLGNLGKIITGNTPKTSETENYCSNDICFVKPSDILDGEITRITGSEFYISEHARQKSRILPPQSVMVTCIGIIGKVAINQVECAFNQQINAVIPDIKKCLPVYLAYAIQYKQAELQNIANSSVVPILNKSQFSNVEVTVPTLTQQHEVIDELEKISELIALRKQQLAKLDELVKSRFIELFGVPGAKSDQWPRMSLGDCCILNPKKNLDTRLVPELNVSFVPMSAVSEDGDMEVSETRKYEALAYGESTGAEVIYKSQSPEQYVLSSINVGDFVCTDEAALHRYLSDLRMEHISGNYSFDQEGTALSLIFDTPEGVLAVTLSDRFIKLVPLYGSKPTAEYFYLPDGTDWDMLNEFIVECPVLNVHVTGTDDEYGQDFTATLSYVGLMEGEMLYEMDPRETPGGIFGYPANQASLSFNLPLNGNCEVENVPLNGGGSRTVVLDEQSMTLSLPEESSRYTVRGAFSGKDGKTYWMEFQFEIGDL